MSEDFGPPADQRYAGPHRPEPEVERDRFGRYMLPDPRDPGAGKFPWTRATTIASTIQDQYNLQRWQQRMVAHGIGKSESLYALAASLDPVSDRGQLQQVCEDALAAAGANDGRNKGTALHGFWERVLRGGDPMTIPQAWRPHIDLAQIRTGQAGLIIPVKYVEAIVFCPDIECVGRTDAIVKHEERGAFGFADYRIADLKTEKSEPNVTDFSYSATQIAVQLAIYAHATHRWLPHERRWEELPVIDRDVAYVLHLPSNAPASEPIFNIWAVDLKMGWEGALLAAEVRAWRKRKNVMIPLGDVVPAASVSPIPLAIDIHPSPASDGVGVLDEHDATQSERASADETCACGAISDAMHVDGCPNALIKIDPEDAMAARVRSAISRDELSALWREWTGAGRTWGPELQEVGAARLRELDTPDWLEWVRVATMREQLTSIWSNVPQTEELAQAIKARLAEIEGMAR